MSNTFDEPGSPVGDAFRNRDHLGDLLIIEVHEIVRGVKTDTGAVDVPRATVTVVNNDPDNKPYHDAYIFGKVIFNQLVDAVGKTILARMTQGNAKGNQSPPWKLDPAGDDNKATAEAFLAKSKVDAMAAPADASTEPF